MLTWAIFGAAVAFWIAAIMLYLWTTRHRRSGDEEREAAPEAAALAWSERHLLDLMERFPRSLAPALHFAHHAYQRQDWSEALHRYQVAIKRNPKDFRGYAGAAAALRGLGQFDESDALLHRARRRFPKAGGLQSQLAWNAMARKDWQEAARCWAIYRHLWPNDKLGYDQGQIALRRCGLEEEANSLGTEIAARFGRTGASTEC
jgi:tetratricopeptide (TPR) repeat protein